ncbi:hypothetical protein G7K_6263-t1 [Saitoella complicata NRRL Y-17804]|uniref:Uncharacterized protein n=1 Tax=Saitoella complicata (strain BCRC 22490 / CBS 7301 / JCM 7358 / NBRC 10748 / NRRL Y-17804) TaxID=698492 RepID=A0A0E9NRW9_SAICN|nr:hypothetical protein G7K_6263-t1 [Saitoella complicata NRRL Y-17804]
MGVVNVGIIIYGRELWKKRIAFSRHGRSGLDDVILVPRRLHARYGTGAATAAAAFELRTRNPIRDETITAVFGNYGSESGRFGFTLELDTLRFRRNCIDIAKYWQSRCSHQSGAWSSRIVPSLRRPMVWLAG